MGFTLDPLDPFYDLMKPPKDETRAEKTARLKREAEAQQASDAIDAQIEQDRIRIQQERKIVKMLLLGQSESGKSTLLKNLRIRYAPDEWRREQNECRMAVHLSVVRAVNAILLRIVEEGINTSGDGDSNESMKFTNHHLLLFIRLAPLFEVETDLQCNLGFLSIPRRRSRLDLFVHDFSVPEARAPDSVSSIAEYRDDMKALWNDSVVQLTLKNHRVHISDTAKFFLDDLDRVADTNYTVTDDDVVRTRLLSRNGVQQYEITPLPGFVPGDIREGWTWRIFDVGGCRTLRRAWLPYFDDVNVIVFLAPLCVFDQRLVEDPTVNRLEDSIMLWTAICSSSLLAKTQLVLFLNKCDLLGQKLEQGVMVRKYVPSYGDRPNDVDSVVKYFRYKFVDIMRKKSPEPRPSYIYTITSIDDRSTTTLLHENIWDMVTRESLKASRLI